MSEQEARALFADARKFTQKLSAAGWIADVDTSAYTTTAPTDLFDGNNDNRPLVVGLFGGTGVGKSSLLNKLAGVDIARTGVVRPTSMEITAYLHSDRRIAHLPEGFPVGQFSEHRHNNDIYRDVVWVDMPDFDSEETQNRDQVMQWLPHIDLLLYVVTPERYKDEEGWRLLLEHGYRHGWLFVMNQWDRAVEEQFSDFRSLLVRAGFSDPVIFRTVSNSSAHELDATANLGEFVARLSERKNVLQLDERGWLQRLYTASSSLQKQIDDLNQVQSEGSLQDSYRVHWQDARDAIQSNLDIPFREFSNGFAKNQLDPLRSMVKSLGGPGDAATIGRQIASRAEAEMLWDSWSAVRLTDSLARFHMDSQAHGVPHKKLEMVTAGSVQTATAAVRKQLGSHLDEALVRPGTHYQRVAGKVLGYLCLLLPVAALAWIGYRVVNGFINGVDDESAYVSVNFLVNGLMLAGLAWLVPWGLGRLFIPSVPDSVYAGLQAAVNEGLAEAESDVNAQLQVVAAEKNTLLTEANQLQSALESTCARSTILENPELKKVLMAYPQN